MALKTDGGPVVLSDYGDMTSGGAPGDSTAILRELLARNLPGTAMITVVDPDAVNAAIEAGVGRTVTLSLGAGLDPERNIPVTVTGNVRVIADGRYSIKDWALQMAEISQGRTVRLEAGQVEIVVSERVGPVVHPAVFRMVGLEPAQAKIVVVKSGYTFRAAFDPIARATILVDSPGACSANLMRLKPRFKHAPRPIFPLDEGVQFDI
jgi:microcystin degradation protein MlrC